MLALDFINVGNGDSILIRELENGQQRYALMVDFGHDCLVRDDHPGELDPRSQRIYAGDFLRELGVERLDMALATHSTGTTSAGWAGCWTPPGSARL